MLLYITPIPPHFSTKIIRKFLGFQESNEAVTVQQTHLIYQQGFSYYAVPVLAVNVPFPYGDRLAVFTGKELLELF